MEPRGQLWFELQRVCNDFRDFSGLPAANSTQVLVTVLTNLLGEKEVELAQLKAEAPVQPSPT